MRILWTLVLKDLKLFLTDRRALLISLIVPLSIASFMASIFGGQTQTKPATAIPVLVVDLDQSAGSKAIFDKMAATGIAKPEAVDEATARKKVQAGDVGVAVIIPKGFPGELSAALTGGPKPKLHYLTDPSQSTAYMVVRGAVTQAAMQAVTGASPFGGSVEGDGLPFESDSKSVTKDDGGEKWSGTAHAFVGMGVQGLLFGAIEAAMGLLRERQQGLWKRLRAAPVPPYLLLLGKLLSTAIRSLLVLTVLFTVGALLFKFKVTGSWIGMSLVSVCVALMVSGLGLFIAALGRNEQQSRGLSILFVLAMTMLGGAWFPTFLMPTWVQTLSLAIPARWAVDGFDDMLWRGLGLQDALLPCLVLLGFAAAFCLVAMTRFRWEAEPA